MAKAKSTSSSKQITQHVAALIEQWNRFDKHAVESGTASIRDFIALTMDFCLVQDFLNQLSGCILEHHAREFIEEEQNNLASIGLNVADVISRLGTEALLRGDWSQRLSLTEAANMVHCYEEALDTAFVVVENLAPSYAHELVNIQN